MVLQYFTEENANDAVLARLANCSNPRLREVMESVTRHLLEVVREVKPTPAEWFQAIQFLTETGQMCDDNRQEWILLSDILGVSMLVDAQNHRKPDGATESTVLGPFHVDGAPVLELGATISRDGKGDICVVEGRVSDIDGTPIPGATLDVWQASDDGYYDVQQPGVQPEMNLRGRFATDADGRYWFRTVMPRSYPIPDDGPVGGLLRGMGRHPYRPAHIHFIVEAFGFDPVTTHIFVAGDEYLQSDAVFGVKKSLVRNFATVTDQAKADDFGVPAPFRHVEQPFVLAAAPDA
ncbi:MAG: intradiol ring-cleavage dioxygenase [Alphaproteobacteria bacterium]|nr:intradiol ring-cleavage dioxygenase [Alphaproteobacteria bacterium]